MTTFTDRRPIEFQCSYSGSCPSVSRSEDGKDFRIRGKLIAIHEKFPSDGKAEATVEISAEILEGAIKGCQANTSTSGSSSSLQASPSALQFPTSGEALVKWLRDAARDFAQESLKVQFDPSKEFEAMIEHETYRAADLIEYQAASIAEHNARIVLLETALKPFADVAASLTGLPYRQNWEDAMPLHGCPAVQFGHLRRARAVLQGKNQKNLIEERSDEASPAAMSSPDKERFLND